MLPVIILVAAVVVIIATSVIKNVEMSSNTKNLIAMVVSGVAGLVSAFVDAGSLEALTAGGVVGTILMVYGAGQVFYKFLLKPSGLDEALETKING